MAGTIPKVRRAKSRKHVEVKTEDEEKNELSNHLDGASTLLVYSSGAVEVDSDKVAPKPIVSSGRRRARTHHSVLKPPASSSSASSSSSVTSPSATPSDTTMVYSSGAVEVDKMMPKPGIKHGRRRARSRGDALKKSPGSGMISPGASEIDVYASGAIATSPAARKAKPGIPSIRRAKSRKTAVEDLVD